MERKMYRLTEKDLAKCAQIAQTAALKRQHADTNKVRLGKKYGLECRDAALYALKGNPEYMRGIWQARIDRANGLDYSEERNEGAYNLGYYRGWTNYESDLGGGMHVPSEYLQEA